MPQPSKPSALKPVPPAPEPELPRRRRWWALPALAVLLGAILVAAFLFLVPRGPEKETEAVPATGAPTEPIGAVVPATGHGVLVVASTPSVPAMVDGAPVKNPSRRSVPPGDYIVLFKAPELGIDRTVTVRVDTGQTAEANPSFTGHLIVSTMPRMDVFLDGEPVAVDSFLVRREIPVGEHTVRLVGKGGATQQIPVTVRLGETTTHRNVFYRETLLAADRSWARTVNGWSGNEAADGLMKMFTATRALYLVLLAFAALVFWQGGTQGRVIVLAALGSGVVAEMLSAFAFGHLWDRARPCIELAPTVHAVAGLDCTQISSFPAPMAAGAMAVGIVLFAWGWRWAWVPVAVILMAGVAPIYAGLHYPIDVAVGYLVGAVFGLMGLLLARIYLKEEQRGRGRSFSPYRTTRR